LGINNINYFLVKIKILLIQTLLLRMPTKLKR